MEDKGCPKFDECHKIIMVLDKDFPGDVFYKELCERVCSKCDENTVKQKIRGTKKV